MATPRQKVQVGLFLSLCALLLVGTLAVLSGWQREETVPYFIEFDETVSGLYTGSEVRYRGVPVGRVADIAVTPQNRVRVKVDIRPSALRLRQGMRAQLNPVGITGQLYINLEGGEPGGEPLPPGSTIPAVPSLFANLSAELPTLLASINSVLMRLDAALGEGGQIVGILQDIEGLITALNTTVSGVNTQSQQLLAQVQALTENEVQALLREVTATARAARQLLAQTTPQVTALLASGTRTLAHVEQQVQALDLQATNRRLQQTLAQVSALAVQLQRSSEAFTLTLEHLQGSSANVEFELRQALRGLRDTLQSAQRLFDYLEQDPSALLVGKRAPGRLYDGQRR